jgi:asparagine synthetase B (glutamine-hydrolysing)
MRMSWTKYLARIAFDGLLPDSVVWRSDKMGFPSPMKVWLKSGIRQDMIDIIHDNCILDEIIINEELGRNRIGRIIDTDSKFGVRLYNLTRTLDMFFGSSINQK